MTNTTIIGLSWGDEGKGKIVDVLADKADYVVRFQGGHNAGHTLVIGDKVIKLSLVPSGIARPNTKCLIGNGVILDPWFFKEEASSLIKAGLDVSSERLMIAENAALILPFHKILDQLTEKQAGNKKIGTTGRGIGPAYEDKIGRRAVYLMDLQHEDLLREKINHLAFQHNPLLKACDEDIIETDKLVADLLALKPFILPYMGCVWRALEQAEASGKKILFEGAQGILLDNDFGTTPYVTSSNTIPAQIPLGTGAHRHQIGEIMGTLKAYTTRVGEGPFPTELFDKTGERLAKQGHEFGTVTGRARRCGWFDAVIAKQAIRLSSTDSVVLTKLDVLDGFSEIEICTDYLIGNEKIDHFPYDQTKWDQLKPIYTKMPGWDESTIGIHDWNALPKAAQNYVMALEDLIKTPIKMVSTGPDRDHIIRR